MREKMFIDLVQKMRDAQREYFKTRTSWALAEAKKLERQVDSMLEHFQRDLPHDNTSQLEFNFNQDEVC